MKKDIKVYIIYAIITICLLMMAYYQISLQGEYTAGGKRLINVMAILITAIMSFIAYSIYKDKKINVMSVFKILVPIIFVMFFICMPIFENHDEDVHWYRIYDMTQGNIITSTEYGHIFAEGSTNYPAGKFPKAVLEVVDVQYGENHSPRNLLSVEINPEDTIYVEMPTTAVYSPIQYAPQAIGAKLASFFTNKPIIIAYTARIANMITCGIILYFAIKLMPFGKEILLLVMCVPIAVEGLTSLSPDGLTISMCLLFVAYIFNLVFNEKIEKITVKHKIIIGILGIIISLCKIVYLPLVRTYFIIAKKKIFITQGTSNNSMCYINNCYNF